MTRYQYLSDHQVEHFLQHGWLRLSKAFTEEKVKEFTQNLWVRLGMNENDQSTWDKERINMPNHRQELVQTFSPLAWGAMCELLGGKDRVDPVHANWNDALIVNLGKPEYLTQDPPHPRDLQNWHVDGDFFRHFLDSPEQGLLVIPLFSRIVKHGGGTMIATDGIGHVARFLADHPEGIPAGKDAADRGIGFNFRNLINKCDQFVELTGEIGDVILMHPLMLHSASHNNLRIPRIITNPPVSLLSPFNFHRSDPSEYSLVELKTILALGGTKETGIDFKPTHPRERIIPDRLKVQNVMMVEEKERLRKMEMERQKREREEPNGSNLVAA